jgi:hypothetical protein
VGEELEIKIKTCPNFGVDTRYQIQLKFTELLGIKHATAKASQ